MIDDMVSTFCVIVAAILLYRFRARIMDRLWRFDRANRTRIEQQEREHEDPLSHFRHTLEMAADQVESIEEVRLLDERLGIEVTRFLFLGEHYLRRLDAERVRAETIRAIAREYYRELPLALAAREDGKIGK